MRNRGKLTILILLVALIFVAGCGNKESSKDDTQVVETQTQQINDEEEERPANTNLLTGVADLSEEAIGKRPVAIMINNVGPALPQYGIAQADIIFEIPVEGDLTRMMALYGDYTKVPKVCSIRSCRKYFPAFSEGFDAIYVFCGMGAGIDDYVASLNLTKFDGTYNDGGLYARDSARLSSGYALEHTMYFDGTGLPDALESMGARVEIEEDKAGIAFEFYSQDEQVKPEGEECTVVNIDFGAALATLTYDAETNTYLKDINGKNQIDGVTGTQLAFTNVFVLETDITMDSNGVHKKVDWTGGENSVGYYVSNGVVQRITWTKESEESRLKFYDEDGNELQINSGKSYIAVNYRGETTFE